VTTDLRTATSVPSWERVALFGAALEAEMARQQLEEAGIPALIQNPSTGLFGPGFAGRSALGVTLLVPSDRVEEARELIEDLVDAFGGEALEGEEL
jgi:hypothetical protein